MSEVFLRTSKGRLHKGVVRDDRVLTDEACNLDDADGPETILTEIPEDADEAAYCSRCFPRPEDQDVGE